MYVFGCRLSLFRLCGIDFWITPVDDITNGITWAVFCFHIAHISFAGSWYLFCLSVYCFGEIMCIWDSYVYQKGFLCFLIDQCYMRSVNPLNPELNPICYLLALLEAHHFLHVSRIVVKLLTFRLLMSYIYGAPILDVSRSHTTTQHSR